MSCHHRRLLPLPCVAGVRLHTTATGVCNNAAPLQCQDSPYLQWDHCAGRPARSLAHLWGTPPAQPGLQLGEAAVTLRSDGLTQVPNAMHHVCCKSSPQPRRGTLPSLQLHHTAGPSRLHGAGCVHTRGGCASAAARAGAPSCGDNGLPQVAGRRLSGALGATHSWP